MKLKVNAKFLGLFIITIMLLTTTSCETKKPGEQNINPSPAAGGSTQAVNNNDNPTNQQLIISDRDGNPIILPQSMENIISLGPSNTEILAELGLGGKIIAIDTFSENVAGITPNIPMFSMMAPDGEQLINLQPDIIFVTGMSKVGGEDPFKPVKDAGICVIYIPSSESIDGIKDDIRYIAQVMGVPLSGEEIIKSMNEEIDNIRKTGETITDRKSVYFEISAAPEMYSFGKGTFLSEMLDIIGADNILGEHQGWTSVSDEAVLNANPDVILTNVNYIDNPVAEIISRPGWNAVNAVKNNQVYYIDTDASSRPSHNIIKALKEIAVAIYPDKF